VISISTGEDIGSMIIGFYSKDLPTNNSDYLARVVQPKLQAVEGASNWPRFWGQGGICPASLAFDPEKMAAHNVTATAVSTRYL